MFGEMNRVVVIDREKQRVIPGKMLFGTGEILTGKCGNYRITGEDGTALKAVIRDIPDYAADPYEEDIKDYSEIIMTEESLIFDYTEFYSGRIPPEKYISPKYKIGDNIVGFTNTECWDWNGVKTTPRLVGGKVTDIMISPSVLGRKYTYEVEYTVMLDVSYSMEQLWRDGKMPDSYYAVDKDSMTATVKETLAIDITDDGLRYRGLRHSEKPTLFYIMSVVLMKAQMWTLKPKDIGSILDSILKRHWNVLFKGEYPALGTLEKYETPIKLIMDGIFSTISSMISQSTEDTKLNSDWLAPSNITCDEVGVIPWNNIITAITPEVLTDSDICGIDQEIFVGMLIEFINTNGMWNDSRATDGNIIALAKQIYGCMKPAVRKGSTVRLRWRDLEEIAEEGPRLNAAQYQEDAKLLLSDIAASKPLMRVISVEEGRCCKIAVDSEVHKEKYRPYTVPYDFVIMDNSDIHTMDRHIFNSAI